MFKWKRERALLLYALPSPFTHVDFQKTNISIDMCLCLHARNLNDANGWIHKCYRQKSRFQIWAISTLCRKIRWIYWWNIKQNRINFLTLFSIHYFSFICTCVCICICWLIKYFCILIKMYLYFVIV